MKISFMTIHTVPDEIAQDYVNMLKYGGIPLLDENIIKKGRQIIEAEGDFFLPGGSDKPIRIPMLTIIEAGTEQ